MALLSVGLALFLIWLLSPLGSQALLRVASITGFETCETQPLYYLNVSHWNNQAGGTSDGQLRLVAPNTLINAALISHISSKNAPQDSWGHVKIPRSSRMPDGKNAEGWRRVDVNSSGDYSSLVGLPIGSVPGGDKQTTTMALES